MRFRATLIAGVTAVLVAAAGGCAARHELQGGAGQTGAASASAPIPELVTKRCGGCHAVPDPSQMSAEKWLAGLERMKRRMELPAAEWDSLAHMARAQEP